MHWGEMARKGGVPPDRVLDAMRLAKLLRHLRRGGKPPAARLAGQGRPYHQSWHFVTLQEPYWIAGFA
jgi:hypothetical protein